MPTPPADRPADSPARASSLAYLPSPRAAATRAQVYRRRRRERPRDRLLRIGALVGAMLVHLACLLGFILGPAYEVEPPAQEHASLLKVRLIERAPKPPPPPAPPPPRGSTPRRVGPLHRGTRTAARTRIATHTAAANVGTGATPVPTHQTPVVTAQRTPTTPHTAKAVAPPAPVSLPHPRPAPALRPVPLAGEPPQITLDTPPTPRPVPPRFQSEPVRPPRAEGTQPMPTPPSLALPELPAAAAPAIAPPTIALDTPPPRTQAPLSTQPLARPVTPSATPPPSIDTIPLPAQQAPQVDLASQLSVPAPSVANVRPQVQAPAAPTASEPELAPVPVAPPAATPIQAAPQAAAIDTASLHTPAPARVEALRPQLDVAVTPSAQAADAVHQGAAPDTSAAAPQAQADTERAAEQAPSSAPDATPQGRDDAVPGRATGAESTAGAMGREGGAASSRSGGSGTSGAGTPGTGANGGTGQDTQGTPGSYVQLVPHGNTEIMEHRSPDLGYRRTRFEDAWTPEGESSVDTALRHAVEKTTVKHVFHLPRGIRIECKFAPLIIFGQFGCHNPDPPAKPIAAKEYERLHLPAQPLAPVASAPAASALRPPASVAPIRLDNAAECAAARVSGGPLPVGCAMAPTTPPQPAPSSSSWVPASDQFH